MLDDPKMSEIPSCDPVLPFISPGWIGVEIGVCCGHSALRLIEYGVRFLYLVDPWRDYEGFRGYQTVAHAEEVYQGCLARLSAYQDRFAVLRMPSAEAEKFIPMVDFVWVDGNHAYEWVKSDLEFYWPKVKAGGVLCGHDYVNTGSCQVARAVDEFAADRSRRLEVVKDCWIMRKEP